MEGYSSVFVCLLPITLFHMKLTAAIKTICDVLEKKFSDF